MAMDKTVIRGIPMRTVATIITAPKWE